MSGSNEKNVFFAYESSVHSINVLLSLNDQRKQDLLCDVTVLVEDQRFRAHRSVLAACSDYFLARIVNQSDADPVITLPEQVSVKGFAPLLQFAYTAKLLLNKDNVSEVCKCAELLGVHNIEASCFQFLKFKFMGNKAAQQDVAGKKCCESLFQKVDLDIPLYDPTGLDIDERVEEFLENEHAPAPCSKLRKFQDNTDTSALSKESIDQACKSFCFERENVPSLCPKYRKFQKAFKEDRIHSPNYPPNVQCTFAESTQSESIGKESVQNYQENAKELPIVPKCEEFPVKMEGEEDDEDSESKERDVYQSGRCSVENVDDDSVFSSHSTVEPHGFLSVPFSCSYEQYDGVTISGVQNSMHTPILNESILASTGIQHEFIVDHLSPNFSQKSDLCTPEESSSLTNGRSNVEREVAEHLAKGFWNDICNTETAGPPQLSSATSKEFSDQIYQEKKSECPWLGITITDSPERTFTNLSSVNCPFISTLATEGFSNSSDLSGGEYIQDQQQEKCQHDCVGEDSETDTEGDSESCSAREQECEVKLPFNAHRIISLSRNDFQSLLKVHKLTSEQLDFVHDIRRRSKNRIAAQRCRKRKLDCIQNLETEIEKLQDEKDNLLKERDHILSTLGETKSNLTELCQQVCREAALSQEQIQILAKYSTPECPLSCLIPEKERMHLPECVLTMSSCIGFPDRVISVAPATEQTSSHLERRQCDVVHDLVQEAGPVSARMSENAGHVEHCVQSGITDFCQQMTDKCTTDE